MGIVLKEHTKGKITVKVSENDTDGNFCEETVSVVFSRETFEYVKKTEPRKFKREKNKDYHCFQINSKNDEILLEPNYFVGIDWICEEKARYIQVEPKVNSGVIASFDAIISEEREHITEEEIKKIDEKAEQLVKNDEYRWEVDYISMLMEIMSHVDVAQHTDHLLLIDWEASEISITQEQDRLTPFLIVRFLKLLQNIVKKGLKKSYYKVEENLRSKVKGKILVEKQIKQNIFRNRFSNTVCTYEVFGEDSIENKFLKKVFVFCLQYIENNMLYFENKKNISWIINYIRPAFDHVSNKVNVQDTKHLKYNPFFKEYKDAIKLGQQILKRFSYNITKTTDKIISTPPFWIDMPKMFELYVYAQFLKDNPDLSAGNFNYQFSTYGNSLDFLIGTEKEKWVVDTKYKLHYNYGQIHNDIRQVAGYARLKTVKEKSPEAIREEIPCLIIYPKPLAANEKINLSIAYLLAMKEEIKAYHHVYKLGISLPVIKKQ
ncbi:5-methylcytosine restriction system specificity protein McrC [Chryseobacterium daecheongense]|uniref:McrBC 5-methylcytosine restriction system component n=1 Tax=Chryseobacterium daecheongense TaxID=192389 RepID=A0A3N0W7Y1_9FLAO|nr:restriction endonuclease [Chryseobacterium daecheongense]ROI00219.1 restriction endonuclease [Chryseobacterium daecheongense]TDX94825.1 McrBC 5-methylcytosine restriction system component [Chryseobacterium daecheongense]